MQGARAYPAPLASSDARSWLHSNWRFQELRLTLRVGAFVNGRERLEHTALILQIILELELEFVTSVDLTPMKHEASFKH